MVKDTITEQLDKIVNDSPKVASKAVRSVANQAVIIVKNDTPKSGQTYARRQQINASRRPYYTSALSNSVGASSLTGLKDFEPRQSVGYRQPNSWWRKFVDHGTKYQKAQKFSSKSRESISKVAGKEFKKAAEEVFGL